MQGNTNGPEIFDPSEQYPGSKYVYVSLDDYELTLLKGVHFASNVPIGSDFMKNARRNFCYFVRLQDDQGRFLTAFRRTSQFSGSLTKKHVLVRMLFDTLAIERDNLFRIENDFDILIDSKFVHIWKPQGFVTLGNLNHEILGAVRVNIAQLQKSIPFVELNSIQNFALNDLNAAKRLKSVCSQQLNGIVREKLIEECRSADVELAEVNGKLVVANGQRNRFSRSLGQTKIQRLFARGQTREI